MTSRATTTLAVVRTVLPLVLWLVFAAWMVKDWVRDPHDPARTGTAAYGHNAEGTLGMGLGFSVAELIAYYLLTWPFLRRRPRWFFVLPLLGVVGLVGWFLLSAVLSMHSGGIFFIHLLWLMALGLALLVEVVLDVISALSPRAAEPAPPDPRG